MVAGATGVDLFLLCVAADDGVMPQTREHLAVLRHLGVDAGVVAVTKADLGDPAAVAEQVRELLPGPPVVPVSAMARTGLDDLRAALDGVAAQLPARDGERGEARLHVDRSFTLRGIGTVVTGTLWSGEVGAGDRVSILPSGFEARIRSVQVHDEPVERAAAGQRVALNLAGVAWREVSRGDVVCAGDSLPAPTHLVDALVALEPGARALERGARVQVHHGTRDVPGRVVPLGGERLAPGGSGYAQLRLEAPLVPAAGDRLILRQLAPPDTIGGGPVIDPAPRKHGPSAAVVDRLAALERGERPPPPRGPRTERGRPGRGGPAAPAEPEPPVLDDGALALASLLVADGREPRADGDLAEAAGMSPAEAADRLELLRRAGQAVRVARNLHFHPEPLRELESEIVAICRREGGATIAGVRDELGTSRRYAQALLEHLDATKVTRRDGDAHVLRRRAAAG
jgi:selenocysteine-specific elongation factor